MKTTVTLRERLTWEPARGEVRDGPRRYFLMRPDVMMGAVAAMGPSAREGFLDGWAASTFVHGADSLRAYAAATGGDRQALIDATTAAAADLGWGRWHLSFDLPGGDVLRLEVIDSPFVAGWRKAAPQDSQPESPTSVCAPIRGMLQALAQAVFEAPAQAFETACAACASTPTVGLVAPSCHFIAHRAAR